MLVRNAILFMTLCLLRVTATPFPQVPATASVPCDDISKYTTEFFIDNRRFDPDTSTCIFYTAKQGDIAKRLTEGSGSGSVGIWDVWPCDLYSRSPSQTNPLRCIMSDDTQRETYFENMSRAYAQICELFATLITPDVNNIPTTGIWARIEQPELERILFFDPPLKRVDTIVAFTPDMKTDKTIYIRPGTKRSDSYLTSNSTSSPTNERRAPPGNLPNCVPAGIVEQTYGDIDW